MQEKETLNPDEFLNVFSVPERGRLVALDPGTKRCGVAVSDENQLVARPVGAVGRTNWKKLLLEIKDILAGFDAVGLVIGLPYNFDGSESEMSAEARRLARNFALSLTIPVVLQDERATSYEARGRLWRENVSEKEMRRRIDGEAAAIILADFLALRDELRARREKS